MLEQLKNGVDPDEQETIEELLDGARARVLAAIPKEALAVLQQLPPQLLESYAVLHQPVEVQAKPTRAEEEEGPGENEQAAPTLTAPDGGIEPSRVQRGAPLYSAPPVTTTMQLDSFQGVYKGNVAVTEGTGKKATKAMRVIAVQKVVYEAELAQVGNQVKEPSYWLPRHNAATVYFSGEKYEVEIAWLLGDYDPQSSGIPAGLHPTPEQIVQWMHDGIDDQEYEIEVIKRHLRTQPQKVWLEEQDMSISDLLGGRRPHTLDVQWIFDDWNKKLGVKQFGF
jgi:hypothetical protein